MPRKKRTEKYAREEQQLDAVTMIPDEEPQADDIKEAVEKKKKKAGEKHQRNDGLQLPHRHGLFV